MNALSTTTKRKQVAANSSRGNRMAAVAGFKCNGLIMAVLLCLAMLALLIQSSGNSLAECQEQLTVESRQQKDKDLTETIDYLEKLDKYFSQIARPRFGRSGDFKRPIMSRFGDGHATAVRHSPLEMGQYDSLIELVNSRLAKKYQDSMNY